MLVEDLRRELRITTNFFDTDLADLIAAGKAELKLSGVLEPKIIETDSLIKRALIIYAKAHFGLNNPDSEKYIKSFESLVNHLCLSQEYTTEAV